jgi:hypothetical protein
MPVQDPDPLVQRIRSFLAGGRGLAGNDRSIETALSLLGECVDALMDLAPGPAVVADRNIFAERLHSVERRLTARIDKLERDLANLHRDTIG